MEKKRYEKPSMLVVALQHSSRLLEASQTDDPLKWGSPDDDR